MSTQFIVDLPILYIGLIFASVMASHILLNEFLPEAFSALVNQTFLMAIALVCLLCWRDDMPLFLQAACIGVFVIWMRLMVPFLADNKKIYTDYRRLVIEAGVVVAVALALTYGFGLENVKLVFRVFVVLSLLGLALQFFRERRLPDGLNRYAMATLSIFSAAVLARWSLIAGRELSLENIADEFWLSMTLIWITFFIAIVRLYFSAHLRENDRIAKRAQTQENRLVLSKQIESLDRQRALGMLASSMQHELRQPLAAMTVNTQLITRALKKSKADFEFVNQCLLEVKQALTQFHSYLGTIRNFIGSSELEAFTIVKIESAVAEVIGFLKSEVLKHNISIRLEIEPDIELRVAANQFNHALLHCLLNAIESIQGSSTHHEGGEIVVSARRHDSMCQLRIEDTGPGMSDQQIQRAGVEIFTTKPSRVGLGLIMISQFLLNCSGHMAFDADGPNFAIVLTLPCK